MRIVKTQKILYNHELRIRLIADNADAEYIRLVRKLPDCKWSPHLNSWHTHNIQDHVFFLNKVFPASIRFYDISKSMSIPEIEEEPVERRILIQEENEDNSLILNFLYDHKLTAFISRLGAKPYKKNGKAWKVSNCPEIITNLKIYLRKVNYRIDYENHSGEKQDIKPNAAMQPQVEERFREILQFLNYENRTIVQYVNNVNRFLLWAGNNPVLHIDRIRDFIDEMSISRNFSRSYQNLLINSIKAYYRYIHDVEPGQIELVRPRRNYPLPSILTRQEVIKIIQIIPNVKHSALISTIYMTGITLSETVSIKPEDIDKDQMQIFVRGRRDNAARNIPLPPELFQKLEFYRNCFHPQNYLFEGYNGSQYSERSVQKVLQKYVKKAGIAKKTTVQTLRHSYAGHKAAEGMDIDVLQRFLGHSSRKSTEIYRKIANLEINSN
jgi:integrase/recombinase XerD